MDNGRKIRVEHIVVVRATYESTAADAGYEGMTDKQICDNEKSFDAGTLFETLVDSGEIIAHHVLVLTVPFGNEFSVTESDPQK